MKNSADLGERYPARSSASVDNILLDLQNSSYPTQPHSIIAKYLTIILRGRAGYEMIYITNGARSAELVMIILYPASPSRIIVLLKTLRHMIKNQKRKRERKECSFRENRKKGIIFRSNAINSVFKNFTQMNKPKKASFKHRCHGRI